MIKHRILAFFALVLSLMISVSASAILRVCPDGTATLLTNPCPFPQVVDPGPASAPIFIAVEPEADKKVLAGKSPREPASLPVSSDKKLNCEGCGAK